jgi:hypothetical protein
MRRQEAFTSSMRSALVAARDLAGGLILVGAEAIAPDAARTWIALGGPLETGLGLELYTVRDLWSGVSRQGATRLFALGYPWNTRVLVGRVDAYLDLFADNLPEIFGALHEVAGYLGTPAQAPALCRAYRRIPFANMADAVLGWPPTRLSVLLLRQGAVKAGRGRGGHS